MRLFEQFELAAGSIVGREHVGESGELLIGKPNQDAIGFRTGVAHGVDYIIATVHDGCSKGPHSEVGARLATEIVVDAIEKALQAGLIRPGQSEEQRANAWEGVRSDILNRILGICNVLCASAGGVLSPEALHYAVREYFQFTIVATLITEAETTVVSIGDGYWAVNGTLNEIPRFEGNAPPYVAYALVSTVAFDAHPEHLHFQIRAHLATADVTSVLIATDGLGELIKHADDFLPGKKRTVGPVEQLWTADRYFSPVYFDPESGRLVELLTTLLLRPLNSEACRLDRSNPAQVTMRRSLGLIGDDLTIVSLRRRQHLEGGGEE